MLMSNYRFTSTAENVDFERVIKEAAAGTPFILSESRDRKTNKPISWALFVNVSLLEDKRVSSIYKDFFAILHEKLYYSLKSMKDQPDNILLEAFISLTGLGRVPGVINSVLNRIETHDLNPKDVITHVKLPDFKLEV
jgi:hypothetical protein